MASAQPKSIDLAAELRAKIKKNPLPKHIAVIMDGNGRWAAKHKLKRIDGHRQGAHTVDALMDDLLDLKIPVVSLYAFSTENWRRPKAEITSIFQLLDEYIVEKLPKMIENDIRFIVSGDIKKLPKKSQKLIQDGISKTRNNKKLLTNFCLNYGSRDETLLAVQSLIEDRLHKLKDYDKLTPQQLKSLSKKPSMKEFERHLFTSGLPDVDLLIRTSGEMRISNFLLYQCAYAELYFTDVHWPDFNRVEFYKSLLDFQKRQRRYGGI